MVGAGASAPTARLHMACSGTDDRRPAPALSRRAFLAGASIAVASISSVHAAPAQREVGADGFRIIRARPGTAALRGPDAATSPIWGYDGAATGPILRAKRGEELKVRLVNELPDPTAVHWHGVRLANGMDGVPGLTQAPIAAGASFDYRFAPPDAGTFWYHPPLSFTGQVARGLRGALIVEEPLPADVDHDVVLVLEDWQLTEAGSAAGPHLTANGGPALDVALRTGDRLRLRLINAAYAQVLSLRIDRHQALVMAIDGEPAEPFPARHGRIVLGPGNRADLFIEATLAPGVEAPVIAETAAGELILARLRYEAAAPPRPQSRADPAPLSANPLPPRIDLARALKREVSLEARAGPQRSGYGPPMFSVGRGRPVMLGLANRTHDARTVHVHGHHFRLLDRLDDGWKPFWLDTLLVPAMETEHIAFIADNPGKWLLHHHALGSNQADPAAWFEVT